MSGYAYGIITVEDFIHSGLRLRLGATRTLLLYREMGGKIRTQEFMERWRNEETRLKTAQVLPS